MATYEQECREAFGVEEWRAGIIADSALTVPSKIEHEDGGGDGRAVCEFNWKLELIVSERTAQ